MSQIKYTYNNEVYTLNITKFKAVDHLDFIVFLISRLPKDFTICNIPMTRDTIKHIIFSMLDVVDNSVLTDEQIEQFNSLQQVNIYSFLFKEAYLACTAEERFDLRNTLLSLLKQPNGTPVPRLEELIGDSKELFRILSQIIDYNFGDFFLIPEKLNLREDSIRVKTTHMA